MTKSVALSTPYHLLCATLCMLVVSFLLVVPSVRAAGDDVMVATLLPEVHERTQLVLTSISERIAEDPKLLAATTVSDPQIAALMRLLEELIKVYQSLLAAQESGEDDSNNDDRVSDLPDLKVVSISPTTVTQGEMVTYKATIKNIGNADTMRSFSVNMQGTDVRVSRLRAGQTATVRGTWGFTVLGTNEVCFPVDFKDVIDESNESNNTTCFDIEVVGKDGDTWEEDPDVSYEFSYEQEYYGDSGQMNIDFEYTIENYHRDLVLDVEPEVNCDDSGIAPTFQRDCSHYLFDLSGKAAEQYLDVQADPYVKGGALYRFTGANGHLYITGSVDEDYDPSLPYIQPIPDNIDIRFILRDIETGRTMWSTTKTAQFKG